jgi:type II secretory pathway pseudopilin PulG
MLFHFLHMPSNLLVRYRLNSKQSAGFGLVELLVSISVMIIVTSVILARHDTYNSATMLRGQAYDLALTTREIQLLAVSATRDQVGFRNVYGLLFSTTNPEAYVVFRDADGDYYFDSGEEFGKQGAIDPRFEIDAIRLLGTGVDAGARDTIAILFERPNFDANLYLSSGDEADAGVSGVEIDLRVIGSTGTGPGELRTIEITRAGQITVKNI